MESDEGVEYHTSTVLQMQKALLQHPIYPYIELVLVLFIFFKRIINRIHPI